MELRELIENFCDENQLYSFEGDSGLGRFEKLLTAIGYRPHGFKYGSLIEVFLADNPGAIEAIIEWMGERRCSEWEESLSEQVEPEDEEKDEEL